MEKIENNIAAVIPAYNEGPTLRDIVMNTLNHCAHVIVVDDGSSDNTPEHLSDLPITLIEHKTNQGKSLSLKHGFEKALSFPEVEAVISLDADGQHNPDDIPKLAEAFARNHNAIVIAARLENTQDAPRHRLYANKTADFFLSMVARKKITDSQSGYRLYPKKVIETIVPNIKNYDAFTFESEILIDAARRGFDIDAVSIRSHYPKDLRPSRFRPLLKIRLIL